MIALREPMPRSILNWREEGKRCTIILDVSSMKNLMDFIHATSISITLADHSKPFISGLIVLLSSTVTEAVSEAKAKGFLEVTLPILIKDGTKIEVFRLIKGRAVGCSYEIRRA